MADLDGVAALHAPARLAVRSQAPQADLADKARVAEGVPEWDHLVIESACPDVTVVGEPKPDIVLDDGQRVGLLVAAHARLAFSVQIAPDGLAVVTLVAGDG